MRTFLLIDELQHTGDYVRAQKLTSFESGAEDKRHWEHILNCYWYTGKVTNLITILLVKSYMFMAFNEEIIFSLFGNKSAQRENVQKY